MNQDALIISEKENYVNKPYPFLKWAGGKRQLILQMVNHFPKSYKKYIEPFVGGGAVFFHLLPDKAILSDNNPDLVTCYKVIKNDVKLLIKSLSNCEYDEKQYYQTRAIDRDKETYKKLSDIEKAARTIYLNNLKELKYGDLIDDELLKKLASGLPETVDLREFINKVYDQSNPFSIDVELIKNLDIAVSCCVASCILIRTNYINYQRYRITKFFFGNKVPQINPSISYINWNANVQNPSNSHNGKQQNNIPPSIISHLMSIQSHRIVDVSKYEDSPDKINSKPDLTAFYHASKSLNFQWHKLNQDELTLKIMLDKGYPIIAAIVVYKEMLNLISYQFGIIKTPDHDNELPLGAHPITIVGYNDKKKIFFFLNSWSEKWGDHGIGEISYSHLTNSKIAGDFAVLDYQF